MNWTDVGSIKMQEKDCKSVVVVCNFAIKSFNIQKSQNFFFYRIPTGLCPVSELWLLSRTTFANPIWLGKMCY